jgi:AGCS family alanine or glycine:cation symporter
MAIFYIIGCLWILILNFNYVPEAISLIIDSAFSTEAVGGGLLGSAMIVAMRYGIARGLFSNESGLGSAPIVAAAAQTRNPVRQALVSASGTFWDTVIICALTGVVLVSCIIAYPDIDSSLGGTLTTAAFSKLPRFGNTILTISLFTFAFSTILGWCYYGEKSIEYLSGVKFITLYRIIWIVAVFLGTTMNLSVVWTISDIMNALMALPNIVSLLLLSGVIVKETKYYLWDKHLNDSGN